MTPTTSTNVTATTNSGTVVTPSIALTATPNAFQKILAVIEALEPIIVAGVSPFIKDVKTAELINSELPTANALIQALEAL